MTLESLNTLLPDAAREEFLKCCHSSNWAEQMVNGRPFADVEQLLRFAEETWEACSEVDGLEAFLGHPKIGDIKSLARKYAATEGWSEGEQSGVEGANMEVLKGLAEGNRKYEEKFGFIFIVCATGKSAAEMLALLEARLPNDRETEVRIAMGEQNKITLIRLKKLLT